MKNLYKLMLMASVLMITMFSCKKDNGTDVQPVNFTVKLSFDEQNAAYGFSFEKTVVKATNLITKQEYLMNAANDGTVAFNGVTPGNYDIATTLAISAADYNAKAGTNIQDVVTYNGTITNQAVTQGVQLAVTLKTGRVGDFVIKQVYYAGSNAANGAVFRDQFIEVYNNSSETLYADSLYFGQVIGNNTAATSVDQSQGWYQTSGQYDWSKSLNMTKANANTNYLYAKTIFMIPGTGKQYPVQPGKSIIIAATALNHQAPFTGNDGKTVTVKDPTLTVDLSAADFEVYMGDQPGINPLASDLDNPAVKNVLVISNNGNRDLILDNLGRDGIFIMKSNIDPKTWDKFATPNIRQITSAVDQYTQIPLNYVVDAINLQHAVTASRIAKRVPDAADAGETNVLGGSYSSQSVVRKTSKVVNGRIVLKDTNNSTNDFGSLTKADPSKGSASFMN